MLEAVPFGLVMGIAAGIVLYRCKCRPVPADLLTKIVLASADDGSDISRAVDTILARCGTAEKLLIRDFLANVASRDRRESVRSIAKAKLRDLPEQAEESSGRPTKESHGIPDGGKSPDGDRRLGVETAFGEGLTGTAKRQDLAGRNVALAVVVNPTGALLIGESSDGADPTESVTQEMVMEFIDRDLDRHPQLCAKVDAIHDVVILTDQRISEEDYAEDMAQCYVRHMEAGEWAPADGLHIFERLVGPITVYVAYAN